MDPAADTIAYITQHLNTQITNLNTYLNTKYKPLLETHQNTKYHQLQQCLKTKTIKTQPHTHTHTHTPAQPSANVSVEKGGKLDDVNGKNRRGLIQCVEEYEGRRIQVDFQGGNRRLVSCINRVFEGPAQSNHKQPKNKNPTPQLTPNSSNISLTKHIHSCMSDYQKFIQTSLITQLNKYKTPQTKIPI